jgi:phospholipid/cholesterol/gamma-HCH transport system substrate-binding protein
MKRANETLVGLVVVGSVVLMVAGSIWLSRKSFGGTDRLASARFRSIGGLQSGNPVLLRGVRIGSVESVRLGDSNWVYVDFKLRSSAEIPQRPAAIISATTLFGDWGVGIASQENLPDDPIVRTQIAEALVAGSDRWPGATLPDIGQLTAQAGRIAGDIALIAGRVSDAFDSTSAQRLQNAFRDLSDLSRRMSVIVSRQQEALTRIGSNLDTGTSSLARGAASLERTLMRVDSATAREQLQRIMGHTDTITADLRAVAANLRGVSGAAAAQQDALGRIIANTDSIMARANAGEGTIGRLSRDTTLYNESVLAVRTLRQMLQDMQANPRKYFSFSVF